jgi:DNA-directed RNA polymerase specialized sigma24 family protein
VTEIGSRDELEAFLVTRHNALLRFGYVLTGNTAAAEDLTQSALVDVFRRWRTVNPTGAEAYTRRAMTRRAWRMTATREMRSLDDIEPPIATQPDRDAALDIRDAVATLTLDSDTQIAKELGCSVGTVKSRGHRAMTEIRAHLGVPTSDTHLSGALGPEHSDSQPG